jgi:transcriptional regulator GlxA family with amidase domain
MLTILSEVIHAPVDHEDLAGLELSVMAQLDGRIGALLVSVRGFEEHARRLPTATNRKIRPLTKAELAKAQSALNEQLSRGVRLVDVASVIGCSSAHFSRTFHATVGVSFKKYLIQLRLASAMKMMSESDAPLCDVASACGFGDQSGFSRAFTRNMGITPFKWRSANRSAISLLVQNSTP